MKECHVSVVWKVVLLHPQGLGLGPRVGRSWRWSSVPTTTNSPTTPAWPPPCSSHRLARRRHVSAAPPAPGSPTRPRRGRWHCRMPWRARAASTTRVVGGGTRAAARCPARRCWRGWGGGRWPACPAHPPCRAFTSLR